MIRAYEVIGIAFLGAISATLARAEEPRPLQHNPFSRPPAIVVAAFGSDMTVDDVRQPLDLRATMVSKSRRFANVSGRILSPGDEIDGYTLLEVQEDRALFLRRGERMTVYVKPERMDDHEQKDHR